MGHTSSIHCVGHPGGYDDDDDVLIQLPDVAREAEKEEKKNSSKGTHKSQSQGPNPNSLGPGPKSQGQNEALVQGFPTRQGDGRQVDIHARSRAHRCR